MSPRWYWRGWALPWLLALACSGASPTVVATTVTIATVETLDDGIAAFVRWRQVEEPKLAHDAIETCRTAANYDTCTSAYLVDKRAPSEKVKHVILAYRDALALAQGATTNVPQAAAELLAALAEVGIQVHARPPTP